MNQIVLGKGLFTSIKGQLCLTKEHFDFQERQVEVKSALTWCCFWHFWFKSRKKIFLKNCIFNKASDPWMLYLSNVGLRKGLHLKTTTLGFFFMIRKAFEKPVNNRLVDHVMPHKATKYDLFSDFEYSFRSSWTTADLLAIVSERIMQLFNRSVATRAVGLYISKVSDSVWDVGYFHKRKSYGISGQILGLISSFLSNIWLRVVLDGRF